MILIPADHLARTTGVDQCRHMIEVSITVPTLTEIDD